MQVEAFGSAFAGDCKLAKPALTYTLNKAPTLYVCSFSLLTLLRLAVCSMQVAQRLSALKQQRTALQKEIKWIVKRDI